MGVCKCIYVNVDGREVWVYAICIYVNVKYECLLHTLKVR